MLNRDVGPNIYQTEKIMALSSSSRCYFSCEEFVKVLVVVIVIKLVTR